VVRCTRYSVQKWLKSLKTRREFYMECGHRTGEFPEGTQIPVKSTIGWLIGS
jgi:hypothetical protein